MLRRPLQLLSSRSLHAATTLQVCVADPRLVLQNAKDLLAAKVDPSEAASFITLDVPHSFSAALNQGQEEVGDTDDPQVAWKFGKQGEFFQYSYLGAHSTASGWTSIITLDDLQRLAHSPQKPSYDDLQRAMDRDDAAGWPLNGFPFLFAGRILESASATVWSLKDGPNFTGLMISSTSE